MLELYKGASLKSYENTFFRKLAINLTNEFNKRNWNGLLIGMPKSITCEYLQIDCMLVTKNIIILIDFKNYSGNLLLPSVENFDNGRWFINDNIVIKGGSSPN